MKLFAIVFAGGALGSVLRYWMSSWISDKTGGIFPWGTFAVNILGSFAMGMFFGLTRTDGLLLVSSEVRVFVMIGFLGGFTTFSSFSLQTLQLLQDQQWLAACGNAIGSLVACIAAVWFGVLIATWLMQP